MINFVDYSNKFNHDKINRSVDESGGVKLYQLVDIWEWDNVVVTVLIS